MGSLKITLVRGFSRTSRPNVLDDGAVSDDIGWSSPLPFQKR
jgi:hypothetical protein